VFDIRYDECLSRITELCKERGWSKYKLYNECDIPKSTLYDMFASGADSQLIKLQKICDGFNITLGEFFADKDDVMELSEEEKKLINDLRSMDKVGRSRVFAYVQSITDGQKKD
jgi:transcriptional regulator with XRE-family HTH domain